MPHYVLDDQIDRDFAKAFIGQEKERCAASKPLGGLEATNKIFDYAKEICPSLVDLAKMGETLNRSKANGGGIFDNALASSIIDSCVANLIRFARMAACAQAFLESEDKAKTKEKAKKGRQIK